MRWPFHFGRSANADTAPAPEPAATRRDWASLPPIQRAVGEPELTAPTMEFVESLAGSHDPGTSIEVLGHQVSLDAPHGLVSGIAAPAATYSSATEMIGRPHRARKQITAQREVDEPMDVSAPIDLAQTPDEAVPAAPIRELAPVEPPALSRKPLTRLADADRTAVMSLASVQRKSVEAAEPPAGRSPEMATATTEAGVTLSERPPAVQRMTLGQSRRLGLGPPMPLSAVSALPRSTTSTPAELQQSIALARPAPAAELTAVAVPELGAGSPPPAAEAATRSDVSTTVQSMSAAATPSPALGLPVLSVITRHSQSSDPTPAPTAQRVVHDNPPPARTRVLTAPAPSVPPATPFAPLVSSRPSLIAGRSTTQTGEAFEPGESAVSATPVQLMPASSNAMEPIPAPSDHAQRVLPGTPEAAARTSAMPPPPEPPPLLMRSPVQRTVVVPEQANTGPAMFEPTFFAVSPFAGGAQEAHVQRQPAAGETPMPPPAAAEVPAASPVAPAAGAAPAHDNEKELDDLARKLHDRISARIRYDLLLDRERAGMLTDLR